MALRADEHTENKVPVTVNTSAISDFREYSVLDPLDYAEYVGFTEEEVKEQCKK